MNKIKKQNRFCWIAGLLMLVSNLSFAQTNKLLEAEAAILSGTAEIATCSNASGGEIVKGLDNGQANSVFFEKINLPDSGEYFIALSYYTVSSRSLNYKLNNGDEQTETVEASGSWCFQGGSPGESIFKVNFVKGDNDLRFYNSPIIDKLIILSDTTARQSSSIYVSSVSGNDSNNGLTPETALQSLGKVNSMKLLPGDSILFKAGETFVGKLLIQNESGSDEAPILFSNYGEGDFPLLNGDGYLSTIHVVNSEYLHFSNLEIKNDGGPAKPGDPENLRYGMYFENSFTDGTFFSHYRIDNLTFRNIYPTIEVTEDDNTGVNAHAIITSGSWGDETNPTRFNDMQIENCLFTRTARHATVFKAINNLVIKNNLFEHVGGAGMVIGNGCTNILVEKNITDHTGSSIDNRMAGRGSGIWCFHSKNLTVQYNHFMYASGIHDSYGMHIDIGNRNVVYQYNYSVGNEGGFVEILGENVNVGYRYNLSIADGWRKRGNRHGQIFWLAGWSGDPKNPVGSDSIFVYNNSIYVPDTITPGIWIENVSKNARIYNNIIHAENEFGPVVIKNDADYNDFDHNIWYGNIPELDEDGESYRGANALTSNPLFTDEPVIDSLGFILQNGSPAFDSGKLIYNVAISGPFDYFHNNGGVDYYGNAVSTSTPSNIGAFNGDGIAVSIYEDFKAEQGFNIYPNPVKIGNILNIDGLLNSHNNRIVIVDVTGKLKFQKIHNNNSRINIDTNGFKPGIYFVRIVDGNSSQVKQVLVY